VTTCDVAGDVAAVLAAEKVLYQKPEVAFVSAEDRYVADDATDLVELNPKGACRH